MSPTSNLKCEVSQNADMTPITPITYTVGRNDDTAHLGEGGSQPALYERKSSIGEPPETALMPPVGQYDSMGTLEGAAKKSLHQSRVSIPGTSPPRHRQDSSPKNNGSSCYGTPQHYDSVISEAAKKLLAKQVELEMNGGKSKKELMELTQKEKGVYMEQMQQIQFMRKFIGGIHGGERDKQNRLKTKGGVIKEAHDCRSWT